MVDQWFRAAIEGRLDEIMAQTRETAARAITAGVKQGAKLTQNAYRRQVRTAGLGIGLEKAWRLEFYPANGASIDFAALLYSKSRRLHSAFSADRMIRAKEGSALVVPTEVAERLGLTRNYRRSKGNKPRKWFDTYHAELEYGPLYTIKGKRGERILMGMVDQQPKALAFLVKAVRLRKLLDLQGPADKFKAAVPGYIANQFKRLERVKPLTTRVILEPA